MTRAWILISLNYRLVSKQSVIAFGSSMRRQSNGDVGIMMILDEQMHKLDRFRYNLPE